MNRKRWEDVTTGVLVVAALVGAVSVAKRAFFPAPAAARTEKPSRIRDDSLLAELRRIGRPLSTAGGGKQIVVLSDYQCPACRSFHKLLRELEAEHPGRFTASLIHYPLDYHRFAEGAAKLAECAAAVERFGHVSDVLFSVQDSLGLLPWTAVIERTDFDDPGSVLACANASIDDARFNRIRDGIAIGTMLRIAGTPLVVLGETRYHSPPSRDEVRRWLLDGDE